jgi:hypothetical protein
MHVLAVKKSWASDLTDHAEHLLSKVEKTQQKSKKKTKDIPLRGRVSRRQVIVGSGYFSGQDTHVSAVNCTTSGLFLFVIGELSGHK